MHIYEIVDDIKFRVSADKPPDLETMDAIKKLVKLASKIPTNGKREKTNKSLH